MVYKRKVDDAQEPRADGISGCPYKFNCKTYIFEGKSIIVIFFSYMALLTLIYGDRMEKTWEACRMAEQEGLPIGRLNGLWNQIFFWMNIPDGTSGPHTTSSYYMKCSCTWNHKDGRRQNACATEAAKTM